MALPEVMAPSQESTDDAELGTLYESRPLAILLARAKKESKARLESLGIGTSRDETVNLAMYWAAQKDLINRLPQIVEEAVRATQETRRQQ